jgi:hypothetical protein
MICSTAVLGFERMNSNNIDAVIDTDTSHVPQPSHRCDMPTRSRRHTMCDSDDRKNNIGGGGGGKYSQVKSTLRFL